jgi:hypothetical protein
MSSITGGASCIATPSLIFTLVGGGGPPPPTGALSTQFNAQFGSPTTPGLGMLNLIMFG